MMSININQFINRYQLLSWLLLVSFSALGDVKISNLDDLNFGTYSAHGPLKQKDNICINTFPLSNYQIIFWGSGPGGNFEITNGVNSLNYQLRYNDKALSGGRHVSPGSPLSGLTKATDRLDCDRGLNANIEVSFSARDLRAASPGFYQGRLVVTITPE